MSLESQKKSWRGKVDLRIVSQLWVGDIVQGERK